MECPACDESMVVLELEDIEIDHCLECGGVWLDTGELEQLLGATRTEQSFKNSLQKHNVPHEARRACPICSQKMKGMLYGTVLIDHCARNHGLWFDRGELDTLLSGTGKDNSRVFHFLQNVFGKKQGGSS